MNRLLKQVLIFHVNRLLADDSHEISRLVFFEKLKKKYFQMSAAAVVIGALRVNIKFRNTGTLNIFEKKITIWKVFIIFRILTLWQITGEQKYQTERMNIGQEDVK